MWMIALTLKLILIISMKILTTLKWLIDVQPISLIDLPNETSMSMLYLTYVIPTVHFLCIVVINSYSCMCVS